MLPSNKYGAIFLLLSLYPVRRQLEDKHLLPLFLWSSVVAPYEPDIFIRSVYTLVDFAQLSIYHLFIIADFAYLSTDELFIYNYLITGSLLWLLHNDLVINY